jgi:DNA polymerase-3 subunit epsilon
MFTFSNKYKKVYKLLKLDKPLIIFDIETTGLSLSTDKIVELAFVKIGVNGRVTRDSMLLDPEIKISLEATAFHEIKQSDVKGMPKFKDKAHELWDIFWDCYYSGFNIVNFDLPMLRREFLRVGMDFDYDIKRVIDTKEIFRYMVPSTMSLAYEYYSKKSFSKSHSAMSDTEAAIDILSMQLEKYKEARDWDFINQIHADDEERGADSTRKFYWLKGEAHFAFSKYKDKALSEVAKEDPEFLKWILVAEFSEETKSVVRMALEGKPRKK